MRTDHTQFPVPMTPAAFVRARERGEAVAKMAAVQCLARVLEAHPDPVVKTAISGLVDLCINPWVEAQGEAIDAGTEVNTDEHYDLVLPPAPAAGETKGGRILFGSSSNCAVRLAATETTAGAVAALRDEDGNANWQLEVFLEKGPIHLNGEELEVVKDRRGYGPKNQFELAAGDEIRVGHHVIHVLEAAG